MFDDTMLIFLARLKGIAVMIQGEPGKTLSVYTKTQAYTHIYLPVCLSIYPSISICLLANFSQFTMQAP